MARKTVNFTKSGVSKIPNNKPVVYKVLSARGKNIYTGIAKRGRVQDRLQEHLATGKISGTKVQIQQMDSIQEAKNTEARIIARMKPVHNVKGK